MKWTILFLTYLVFQPFCQSDSTTGVFYVSHEAYSGFVSFGNNVTISVELARSPESASGLCRKRCTEDTTCLAYQIRDFLNYSDCTLFRENLCTGAILLNITGVVGPSGSIIWEKVDGRMSAASCLFMQQLSMQRNNRVSVVLGQFNDSLPVNFTKADAPKICKDYYLRNVTYSGELVPIWPWGYENGSVKVRCYGKYTAVFTTAFHDFDPNDRSFWVIDKLILLQPNVTQVDEYSRSLNFTLLSYLVNLPSVSRELKFQLTCQCWGLCWKEYQETYASFNVTNDGSLQLGSYTGNLGDGFTSTAALYPFSASGDCGNFWSFSRSNSCDQKTFLLRHQAWWKYLLWNGVICTKAKMLFV